MEGGPPCFPPGFTCPAVLRVRDAQPGRVRLRGSNPVPPAFPCRSAPVPVCHCAGGRQAPDARPCNPGGANPAGCARSPVWPLPRSLAATGGISVDFSSSAYLDVSVRRVVPRRPMGSAGGRQASLPAGFAHSEIRGSQAMCASPRLIAACHVLRRLPVPRHPPCAFSILPAPRAGARGARFLNAGVLSCAVAHTRAPGRGPGDQMRPLPLGGRGLLRVLCGSQGAEGRALGTGCRGASGARGDGGPPAGRARLRELR